MPFAKEPQIPEGTVTKTAVVLVNLGTPDEPTPGAVRRYLKEFLSDPRVVEIPKAIWWFILNGIILPFRSKQSAQKYASIWTIDGSPLKFHTQAQAKLLRGLLGERGHNDVTVAMAMRYGSPSLPDVLAKLKADGHDRILILPAYPQYSGTTTASVSDAVFDHYKTIRNVPELRFVRDYHDHDGYVDALKKTVLSHWETNGRGEKLLMSFHGVPKRTIDLGDTYQRECMETARLLAQKLRLNENEYLVTFQSRFGKAEWLQPYTAPTVAQLAKDGVRKLDVICPGFTSDCLETLEEIAMEVRHEFKANGGKEFNYIPCLNSHPAWILALTEVAEQHMIGWPTMSSMRKLRK